MTKPKISIIVYDGSFRQRFFQVDSLVNQTLDKDKFEYIFVENFDKVNPKLKDKLQDTSLTYKLITLNRNKSYHLGKCANTGVKQIESNLVVILDADTYLEPNVLEQTLNYHSRNSNSVLYIHRYDEPKPPMLRNSDNIILSVLQSKCELLNPENYGGFMSVSKDDYIEAKGYDQHESFSGYDSAGALDLKIRYENVGLSCEWSKDLKIYHICHKNAFGDNRWNGFRVETQWKMINRRKKREIETPVIGYKGRCRELGEWYEEWIGNWDDKSINYVY